MNTFFEESLCYFVWAGFIQAFGGLLLIPFFVPFASRLGITSFPRLLWAYVVFNACLLFWGALGHYAFHSLTYGKLYVSADRVADWLPFIPFGPWVISREFAGRHGQLLGDASVGQLFLIWLAIAVPVWALTFYSTRCVLRLRLFAIPRFPHAQPMA